MKHHRLLILGLMLTVGLKAQTFSEKVALKACDCLDSLKTYQQLEDSIKNCTTKAMVQVMDESSSEEQDVFNTVEGIKGLFREVHEMLPSYCYNVRRLMVTEKKRQFYKLSSIPEANEHYTNGNDFLDREAYVNAIKEFQKAIKIDKNFVYAYDNIAISYRRQENFSKAIKFYQKSLNIFPEGDVALLNIAVAYSFLKDYDNSLKYYNNLIFLYQNDPEGYFGAGKIQFAKSDYENALQNIFIAHRMYIESNSEYKKDSEQLIFMMYNELKEQGKLNVFSEMAKKYNISINE